MNPDPASDGAPGGTDGGGGRANGGPANGGGFPLTHSCWQRLSRWLTVGSPHWASQRTSAWAAMAAAVAWLVVSHRSWQLAEKDAKENGAIFVLSHRQLS